MSEFDFVKSTPGLGQMAIAKRMVEAVSSGEISEWRFGCFQQEMAKALHPEASSLGEAITKTMDSEIGRILWGPRNAVTTDRNRELMKRERGEVEDSSSHGRVPRIHHVGASKPVGDDSDSDPDDELDKLGEQYRREHPDLKLSHQQAVAHVIEHTDEGRAAFQRSKTRSVAKNAC